jgi:hypothetical protein
MFNDPESHTYYRHIREDVHWNLAKKYPLLDHLGIRDISVEPPICRAISEHPRIRNLLL